MKLTPNEQAVKEKVEKNSKRGKTSRNKGSNYERGLAKIFSSAFGIEMARTPMSGGFQKKRNAKASEFKGDIVSLDDNKELLLHIEAKNQKTWSLKKWIDQAKEDCPEDKVPIVVFHENGTSNEYVTLGLNDFLDLVDYGKVVREK